mmetsp:Transcript_33127/g.78110  ORF Transcript_33127/g.78110 Transcript_33127/m.78110 type:complete len:81 (+) Transcript_33127:3-245(+)
MFALLTDVVMPTHSDSVRETPGRFQKMWSAENATNHGPTGWLHHDRMASQPQPMDSPAVVSKAKNSKATSKMSSFLSTYN